MPIQPIRGPSVNIYVDYVFNIYVDYVIKLYVDQTDHIIIYKNIYVDYVVKLYVDQTVHIIIYKIVFKMGTRCIMALVYGHIFSPRIIPI